MLSLRSLVLKKPFSMLPVANRTMVSHLDGLYHTPETLEDMMSHMEKTNPDLALLYFHAKWNPVIPKIEKEYLDTCAKFGAYKHFKIDCD